MEEKPFRSRNSLRWRLFRLSAGVVCFAGLSVSALRAADIIVNRVNDSGAGSLRQGLNGAAPGDLLSFDPILNGTTLQNGGPLVVSNGATLFDANGITVTDSHAFTLASSLTVNWTGTLGLNGILSDGASIGSLITNGTGTLILSGANTFTGGTTLNAGSLEVANNKALGTGALTAFSTNGTNPTLILDNGINLQNSVILQSGLTVNTAAGTTSQLSGIISEANGGFGLTTTGNGTLILSGANTFSGGIFVTNNSTIRAENSQSLGSGNVTVAGALTLDMASGINLNNNFSLQNALTANVNSGTATLSGLISETVPSTLTKTGAGTLILGGANSYTGGTTVSQGTLQGDSTSLVGTITNNASLVFNQAETGIFTGNIGGTGSLTKTGIGTLIFSGNNTSAGTTTVNTGELQVLGSIANDVTVTSINGALTGTGSVGNVINNGYIQPGTGATNNPGGSPIFNIGNLNVNGNFTQQPGGTTEIKFNSTGNTAGVNNDLLTVTGKANLEGTLKVFAVGGGAFTAGTQYTVLNAAGGVFGHYGVAASNLSFYGVDVTYGANDVTFELVRTSSLSGINGIVGETPNQNAVGNALDNISLSASGALFTMVNGLGVQSSAQQQQALNQLSGQMFGNTQTLGLEVGDLFQQRVASRLTGNSQFLVGQSAISSSDEEIRGQSPMYGSSKGWMQGYGVGGSLRSDGNGAGVNYSQGGAIYGMDWGDEESGTLGVAGGNSYVGFKDGFGGSGQLTSYQIGLYAIKQTEAAYVLGSTNYGYNVYSTNRNVTVPGISQSLHGNFNGNQAGANVETGLKLVSGRFHFQPLVGLQYLYLAQQGFDESGGSAALSVAGTSANSLRTNVGARIVADQFTGPRGALWTPYTNLRLVSELLNNDRVVNASFNGSPIGGAFNSSGTKIGNNYGVVGQGVQVRLNDQWSLFGGVDLMLGGRIMTETGSCAAMYYW